MSGYLEGYGVSEVRRERIWHRIALVLLVIAVAGGLGYYFFRDWREQRQARQFLELLQQKNYDAAYRMWGCDPANPCRDYSMAKFMEDWGPKAEHPDPNKMKLGEKKSCKTGIIQDVNYPGAEPVQLWVERQDLRLSFAPWPVCDPRWQAPSR